MYLSLSDQRLGGPSEAVSAGRDWLSGYNWIQGLPGRKRERERERERAREGKRGKERNVEICQILFSR